MRKIIPFSDLSSADLFVDALYKSGSSKNVSDDPISKLVGCGNQGGIRFIGIGGKIKLVVLYSSQRDIDWPDILDERTGKLIYFGDNKKPGFQLNETKGNKILQTIFENLHLKNLKDIPPIFVFFHAPENRDVIFKGLAVPGATSVSQTQDLIALWKTTNNQRFQNYQALFSILDISKIERAWIKDIMNNQPLSKNCPKVYLDWIKKSFYTPLQAEFTSKVRKKEEQIPNNKNDIAIVKLIHSTYKNNSYGFEKCAAELVKLMDSNFIEYNLTRPWLDGGIDAFGEYRVGISTTGIDVEFALEAKCYALDSGVGIRHTSRLISRIRFRQFGIFITTSFLLRQTYKEIIDDGHPILIITAIDIIHILKKNGYNNIDLVKKWLSSLEVLL